MNWRTNVAMLAVGLLATACGKSNVPVSAPPAASALAPVAPAAPAGPVVATHAQAKLRTVKLWMGAEEMTAEIAFKPEEIGAGLMFRTNLEENAGMLFLLGPALEPRRPAFWMKNVPMDLSAAFMDPKGYILEFHDFQAENTNHILPDATNVEYVLETSRGWFEKHHIEVGMLVRTQIGTFPETFHFERR